ncbi:MAG: hypothetical protein IPJ60_18990 [Sphingobacteriaceae bacterium]|nr:hypothetical protein [Sphingobacteriaceae bacterium]
MSKRSVLFSNFLSAEQLKRVTYYSYFPVLEDGSGDDESFKLFHPMIQLPTQLNLIVKQR